MTETSRSPLLLYKKSRKHFVSQKQVVPINNLPTSKKQDLLKRKRTWSFSSNSSTDTAEDENFTVSRNSKSLFMNGHSHMGQRVLDGQKPSAFSSYIKNTSRYTNKPNVHYRPNKSNNMVAVPKPWEVLRMSEQDYNHLKIMLDRQKLQKVKNTAYLMSIKSQNRNHKYKNQHANLISPGSALHRTYRGVPVGSLLINGVSNKYVKYLNKPKRARLEADFLKPKIAEEIDPFTDTENDSNDIFLENYSTDKNLDDKIQYILNQVQPSIISGYIRRVVLKSNKTPLPGLKVSLIVNNARLSSKRYHYHYNFLRSKKRRQKKKVSANKIEKNINKTLQTNKTNQLHYKKLESHLQEHKTTHSFLNRPNQSDWEFVGCDNDIKKYYLKHFSKSQGANQSKLIQGSKCNSLYGPLYSGNKFLAKIPLHSQYRQFQPFNRNLYKYTPNINKYRTKKIVNIRSLLKITRPPIPMKEFSPESYLDAVVLFTVRNILLSKLLSSTFEVGSKETKLSNVRVELFAEFASVLGSWANNIPSCSQTDSMYDIKPFPFRNLGLNYTQSQFNVCDYICGTDWVSNKRSKRPSVLSMWLKGGSGINTSGMNDCKDVPTAESKPFEISELMDVKAVVYKLIDDASFSNTSSTSLFNDASNNKDFTPTIHELHPHSCIEEAASNMENNFSDKNEITKDVNKTLNDLINKVTKKEDEKIIKVLLKEMVLSVEVNMQRNTMGSKVWEKSLDCNKVQNSTSSSMVVEDNHLDTGVELMQDKEESSASKSNLISESFNDNVDNKTTLNNNELDLVSVLLNELISKIEERQCSGNKATTYAYTQSFIPQKSTQQSPCILPASLPLTLLTVKKPIMLDFGLNNFDEIDATTPSFDDLLEAMNDMESYFSLPNSLSPQKELHSGISGALIFKSDIDGHALNNCDSQSEGSYSNINCLTPDGVSSYGDDDDGYTYCNSIADDSTLTPNPSTSDEISQLVNSMVILVCHAETKDFTSPSVSFSGHPEDMLCNSLRNVNMTFNNCLGISPNFLCNFYDEPAVSKAVGTLSGVKQKKNALLPLHLKPEPTVCPNQPTQVDEKEVAALVRELVNKVVVEVELQSSEVKLDDSSNGADSITSSASLNSIINNNYDLNSNSDNGNEITTTVKQNKTQNKPASLHNKDLNLNASISPNTIKNGEVNSHEFLRTNGCKGIESIVADLMEKAAGKLKLLESNTIISTDTLTCNSENSHAKDQVVGFEKQSKSPNCSSVRRIIKADFTYKADDAKVLSEETEHVCKCIVEELCEKVSNSKNSSQNKTTLLKEQSLACSAKEALSNFFKPFKNHAVLLNKNKDLLQRSDSTSSERSDGVFDSLDTNRTCRRHLKRNHVNRYDKEYVTEQTVPKKSKKNNKVKRHYNQEKFWKFYQDYKNTMTAKYLVRHHMYIDALNDRGIRSIKPPNTEMDFVMNQQGFCTFMNSFVKRSDKACDKKGKNLTKCEFCDISFEKRSKDFRRQHVKRHKETQPVYFEVPISLSKKRKHKRKPSVNTNNVKVAKQSVSDDKTTIVLVGNSYNNINANKPSCSSTAITSNISSHNVIKSKTLPLSMPYNVIGKDCKDIALLQKQLQYRGKMSMGHRKQTARKSVKNAALSKAEFIAALNKSHH